MKSFLVLVYLVLLISGLLIFGPTAHATMSLTSGESDILYFSLGNQYDTLTIPEGKGEEKNYISFSFVADSGLNFGSRSIYLVEPGAKKNRDGTYTGISDIISLKVHADDEIDKYNCILKDKHDDSKYTFTVTMKSDPGLDTDDVVRGYLETGSLQNITAGLFSVDELKTLKCLHETPVVEAASDVAVPEPATLILFGLGLLGIVAVRRKMRSEER